MDRGEPGYRGLPLGECPQGFPTIPTRFAQTYPQSEALLCRDPKGLPKDVGNPLGMFRDSDVGKGQHCDGVKENFKSCLSESHDSKQHQASGTRIGSAPGETFGVMAS